MANGNDSDNSTEPDEGSTRERDPRLPPASAFMRAREREEQVREMDQRVYQDTEYNVDTGEEVPVLSFDEMTNWATLSPREKEFAFRSGRYGISDPTDRPAPGIERRYITDELSAEERLRSGGVGPARPRSVRDESEPLESRLERYRSVYGDSVIRTAEDGTQELNTTFISAVDQRRAANARAPTLYRSGQRSDEEGILSRQGAIQEVLDRRTTHVERLARFQNRIIEDQGFTYDSLLAASEAEGNVENTQGMIEWMERVQALSQEPPSEYQQAYRGLPNYAGPISVDDMFPHLQEHMSQGGEIAREAREDWMWLTENLSRGVDSEFIEAESEVEWSIMDREHDIPVVNMQHIASVIAEQRINTELQTLPREERPAGSDVAALEDFRAERIDHYEAEAMRRLQEIRGEALSSHYALFDPDSKSLRRILDEQADRSYMGSVLDAWWSGMGANKTSVLYENGETFMVEHEGLLDFAWRGVPGLAMGLGEAIDEEQSIIDIYDGVYWQNYSQQMGEAIVTWRPFTSEHANGWLGFWDTTDATEEMQPTISAIGNIWAFAQTIASPDLITLGTLGMGTFGRGGGIAAGLRAAKMEKVAVAAEGVDSAWTAWRSVAGAGARGFWSGLAGQKEIALAAARGRYLNAEAEALVNNLDSANAARLAAGAGRTAAQASDEAAQVQQLMDRIESVLGKVTADQIRTQFQARLASDTGVGVATHIHAQRAIAAEARLSEGVQPVMWQAGRRTAQETAQRNRGRFAPGGGRTPQLPTEGVTRGGLPSGPGRAGATGGQSLRPGTTGSRGSSRRVPVNVQDDSINLVRQAVETGRTIWQSLKNATNPLTGKKWTPAERLVVAELELAATEAAHIAQGAHLAELQAHRTILQSFSGRASGTVQQLKTAGQNARRALDELRRLRQELSGLTNSPRVGTGAIDPGQYASLQRAVENARRAKDLAIQEFGRVAGASAHTFLDARIANAEKLFLRTGQHLGTLETGIARSLGRLKKVKAGLHNKKRHWVQVRKAQRNAREAYQLPAYRIFGNIVRSKGSSESALASIWASPAFRGMPSYRKAMNRLAQKGFLGRRTGKGGRLTLTGVGKAAEEIIQDPLGLRKELLDMYDIVVLEEVAMRRTADASMLRSVLNARSSTVLPSRSRMTKGALARNIEILTNEGKSILIAQRGGAQAQATIVATAELARHNPRMLSSFWNMGARNKFIRGIENSVYSFTKPWLHKVGWGNAEVTAIHKGIENIRKDHSQRLTMIFTSGKDADRAARASAFLTDTMSDGQSIFSNGIAFLRRAVQSKDPDLIESVNSIFQSISNSHFARGTDYTAALASGVTREAAMLSDLKKAIGSGRINTWDDLVEEVIKNTSAHRGLGPKPTAASAYRNAIKNGDKPSLGMIGEVNYAESMIGQAIIAAAAQEVGLSRMAGITAHLSDDAIKGLAALQRGDILKMGTATWDEIADVAQKLGIPPGLTKVWTRTNEKLRMGIQVVEKNGGLTFLNQRTIDEVMSTLEGTIKTTQKYYREAGTGVGAHTLEFLSGIWRNTMRMMTTGLFHMGYYANMTLGNFSQTFAEAGLGASLAVGAASTIGMVTPALTKVPIIGPRIVSKYERLMGTLTLPRPMLSLLDGRTTAIMNTRMLSDNIMMTLPSGERMTVGAYRTELQMAGAFDGLTASIAPLAVQQSNRTNFLERAARTAGWDTRIRPTKVITAPMEWSAHLFNYMEVAQRISLYNYLRLNKGMSKARAGQVMRNSLYDWAFASTDAERWYSSIIMFFNFHKLSTGRGLAHLTQPYKAGRGTAAAETIGGGGFFNSLLRTSPLHPDAYASARINMYDRLQKQYVEEPGLAEAGVSRPGWANRTFRPFVGGGQLTEEQQLALMEVTGRDATDFVLSAPAPTPESVLSMLYNMIFAGARVAADEDFDLFGDFTSVAADELAARANPIVRGMLSEAQSYEARTGFSTDTTVRLYSPVHRWLATTMEAVPGINEVWSTDYDEDPAVLQIQEEDGQAGVMYVRDRPYTIRVPEWQATLLSLMTLPLSRKIDPLIEAGALDMNTEEAIRYWLRQNAGVNKRHYTNPEQEARWRRIRFDMGVDEELDRVATEIPGGRALDDSVISGPSLQNYEADQEANRVIGDRHWSQSVDSVSAEEARRALYRSRVLGEQ